jgi:type IV pilus assembly protein PilB
VIAQRLVRRICVHCRRELPPEQMSDDERLLMKGMQLNGAAYCRGGGCEKCRFTGYRGRIAVGEVLVVSPAVRELIQARQPADAIRRQAVEEGMQLLRDSALAKVAEGVTTVDEVLRVAREDLS